MLRYRGTEIYRLVFSLRLTIFLSLFCLLVLVSNAQTAQPTPKPSPTPRRPLPKLSNSARGFDTRKEKDASPRLIAVGGGWGGGDEEKGPKLKRKIAQGYYRLGSEYLERVEYSKAIIALEKAVKLNPNYAAAYNALGEAYALDGVYEEFEDKDKASKFEQMRERQAIRAFEQARRLATKNAYAYLNLGVLYFNTGQFQKAVDAFQQGLYLKPKRKDDDGIIPIMTDEGSDYTTVYGFIGKAYEYLGQYESAIKFYLQALTVKFEREYLDNKLHRRVIYLDLGELYENLSERDKALAIYQNFVSETADYINVDTGDVFSSIGRIYAAKQKYNEAAVAFGKAANIYEWKFNFYKQLLAEATEAKERKVWEEEITSLRPKLTRARYNSGVAQSSLNQTEEAIESFKRVIELDEKNTNAHFNMGVAYLALGNKDAAQEQAQLLKAIDSELASELEKLIDR